MIDERRRDLSRNLEALQGEARALVDWRRHYRRHTGAVIAVAAAAGAILGLMSAGSRPRGDNVSRGRRAQRVLHAIDPANRAGRAAADLRDGIVDALVGVASAKVSDAVGRVVPTYKDRPREWPQGPTR